MVFLGTISSSMGKKAVDGNELMFGGSDSGDVWGLFYQMGLFLGNSSDRRNRSVLRVFPEVVFGKRGLNRAPLSLVVLGEVVLSTMIP
jgi:hypothetical protein